MTDEATGELGITDYLHEIELWQQRLQHWQRLLVEPEGAAAASSIEKLLQLSEEAGSHCRLIRQKLGFDEGLDQALDHEQSLEAIETELGLVIWQIMREDERLQARAPARARPVPKGLPRARLRVDR